MSIRRLAAWAVIFFGLLAYVLAVEKPAPKPKEPAQRADYEKAFDLSQADIASATIMGNGKSATISAKNLKWVVTDPPGAEVLPEQCETIIATITETVVLSVVEQSPADLKQYGLDAPELAISVKADDGRQMTLKLGKKSPSGVSLYGLDVERRRVVVVGTYIAFSMKMFLENMKVPQGK